MRDDQPLNTEVAVLTEDGLDEDIGLLAHWACRRDEDGETTWWGHVTVYRSHDRGGQYRAALPADRIVPLIYCGRLPTGAVRHSDECQSQMAAPEAS